MMPMDEHSASFHLPQRTVQARVEKSCRGIPELIGGDSGPGGESLCGSSLKPARKVRDQAALNNSDTR